MEWVLFNKANFNLKLFSGKVKTKKVFNFFESKVSFNFDN